MYNHNSKRDEIKLPKIIKHNYQFYILEKMQRKKIPLKIVVTEYFHSHFDANFALISKF